MRYAAITGAPEPPTAESVRGWAVQYPFDGLTAEEAGGAPIVAECSAQRHRRRLLALTAAAGVVPVALDEESLSVAPVPAPLTSFRSSSVSQTATSMMRRARHVPGTAPQ
jgi:hypothetical protein